MEKASNLDKTVRKTLSKQTSDQLFNKLKNDKLMGKSKEVAIEILTERKAKGTFSGDLSKFKVGGEVKKEQPKVPAGIIEAAKDAAKTKAPKEKKAKKEKAPKEKKEKKEKVSKYPDFKPKFKVGQEVKFTPFRETKSLTGTIVSVYPVARKKEEDFVEAVRVKVGKKIYEKNALAVELVK